MTLPLTRRQKDVLDFIRGFIAREGISPSLQEIADGVKPNLRALATVHKHVENLRSKGWITRRHGFSRTTEPIPQPVQMSTVDELVDAVEAMIEREHTPDDALCHVGICSPEQCARCGKIIRVRRALDAVREAQL